MPKLNYSSTLDYRFLALMAHANTATVHATIQDELKEERLAGEHGYASTVCSELVTQNLCSSMQTSAHGPLPNRSDPSTPPLHSSSHSSVINSYLSSP